MRVATLKDRAIVGMIGISIHATHAGGDPTFKTLGCGICISIHATCEC